MSDLFVGVVPGQRRPQHQIGVSMEDDGASPHGLWSLAPKKGRRKAAEPMKAGSTHKALQAARAAAAARSRPPAFLEALGPPRMSPRGLPKLRDAAGQGSDHSPAPSPRGAANPAYLQALKEAEVFSDKGWFLFPPSLHGSARGPGADRSVVLQEMAQHRRSEVDEDVEEAPPSPSTLEGRRRKAVMVRKSVIDLPPGMGPVRGAAAESLKFISRGQLKRKSVAVGGSSPPPPPPPKATTTTVGVSRTVFETEVAADGDDDGDDDGANSPRRRGYAPKEVVEESVMEKMRVQRGLGKEQIVGQLATVKWFAELSLSELHRLYERGRHKFFPRYSTIIREGNQGSFFYVLLQGQIACTSVVKDLNVVLKAGASFGEGALITRVRREASVAALEHCYLLQFHADDIRGLNVNLSEVKRVIYGQILQKVPFFKSLSRQQQEGLSAILEVEYFAAGDFVFHEGGPGDKLYILYEGHVEMWKRASTGTSDVKVAQYYHTSERPWFGEMALWAAKPRGASALVTEPAKVLVIPSVSFATFLDIAPTFQQMFETSKVAYKTINMLRAQTETEGEERAKRALMHAQMDARDNAFVAGSATPAARAVRAWERVVAGLLLQKTDDASRRRSTIHEQKRRATKLMAPIEVPRGATRFR